MTSVRTVAALRVEAFALSQSIAELSPGQWELPTRCAPWSVRELLGHVRVVIGWLPGMLAEPPPERAGISAVEYYRPDDRFAPEMNAARIALARDAAPVDAAEFAATWEHVERLCAAEPAGRIVRTRHGDAMLLSEFLLTRVVEVAVHGLDLADALGREPWLTPQAADAVLELLLGPDHLAATRELGGDRAVLLRKATGRSPLSTAEAGQVRRLGLRWLTLG